jgi:hypothetical protein
LTPLSNQWRRRRRSSGTHILSRLLGVLALHDAGMRFVNTFIGEHEGAGLKSVDKGLILLRCNSKLRKSRDDGVEEEGGDSVTWTWLNNITDALWN